MSETFDVVVVGSGAGGLAAACKAALEGARTVVLEQSDRVGGTTAISGGMIWAPGNDKMAALGAPDSDEAARAYLEATLPPGERERLDAYLGAINEAIRDFEAHTSLRLQVVRTYPDYYPDVPGATTGGRVLEPVPFDGASLGAEFATLRDPLPEFTLFGGMMVSRADIPHFRKAARSLRSALRVARLLAQYGAQRLRARRGTTLYLGNALVARLFKSALDLGVTVRTGRTACEVSHDETGRVRGLRARAAQGAEEEYRARAVILATGGVSHDRALRSRFTPHAAGDLSATVSPGQAPRGASIAQALGAKLSAPTPEGAFWVPASTFTRADGSLGVFPHTVTDRAKPGLIAVGGDGRRFVNEAVSYHEFVRAQLREPDRAIPAWLICDSAFVWRYGLGKVKPFAASTREDVASGYLKRADSLADLAKAIGAPPGALQATVEQFNEGARRGEDAQFGRGADAYQRHLGDGERKPNPCVAPIEAAPFYAVAVRPADLGMSAGIVTDAQGRVLREDGSPIAGLFACGADMASVMEGAYPGPGITLGPALAFGWLAGRAAAGLARAN